MYPPLPLNVPGVVIHDRVFDADHRVIIAQEDWIGASKIVIRLSLDGGVTWVEIADFAPVNGIYMFNVAWDGADTYLILTDELAADDWALLSTDGGSNWARLTGITTPVNFDETNLTKKFAYGLNAWWHDRVNSLGNHTLYKSTDNGSTWTVFHDNGATDTLDWLIHLVYGLVGWDVNTLSNGIRQSSDGIAAFSTVLTHAAAPWTRIDDADAMFGDGNGNLFGFFQLSTIRRAFYNDDPTDLTSWKEAAIMRQPDQTAQIAFSLGGSGKWLWDGSNTTRRGLNSAFVAGTGGAQNVFWWTKDGSVWSQSPMNRSPQASTSGAFGSRLENYMPSVL